MIDKIKKTITKPRKDPRKKRYRKENLAGQHPRDLDIERTSIHTGVRVLFVKRGCHFCKEWKEIIPYINKRLDPKYQSIEIVDIKSHDPRVKRLNPQAAPELYIDGVVVKGITVSEFGIGFLEKFLEDELVV